MIEEQPTSLIIPSLENATFSCKALCENYTCLGYWIIDNQLTKNPSVKSDLEANGYYFPPAQSNNMSKYTLTMTVNASESMNNTTIRCMFTPSGHHGDSVLSNTVTLLVISGKYRESNKPSQLTYLNCADFLFI